MACIVGKPAFCRLIGGDIDLSSRDTCQVQVSGLIRSTSLSHFGEVARRVGLDPGQLLREFGLPQRCLTDPELTVPTDAVRELLENTAERSGVEGFGLLMAEARRLSDLGPLGLLVREQPTLRLAVEAFVHYGRRLNEALLLEVEEAGDVVVLREELIVGKSCSVRQSTELAIGVAFRTLCTLLGPGWRARRVCFAHDAPADRSVHERVFGCSVEFGHDFNGIVCTRADLDRPNPNADPAMAKYAQHLLDTSFAGQSADMTTQVRQLIASLLGTGQCTIERVAQYLGVDRRTVHRHLARESETFSGIVDSVREELCDRYLENRNRSLTEVSSLLGFSDPSGFSRWYRRRFNSKPSERRARRGRLVR
jgi:AraC-like DNA-binding protein